MYIMMALTMLGRELLGETNSTTTCNDVDIYHRQLFPIRITKSKGGGRWAAPQKGKHLAGLGRHGRHPDFWSFSGPMFAPAQGFGCEFVSRGMLRSVTELRHVC
jgi:hypothetical protein